MDTFVERGGNFLDTADFYSRWLPGHSGGESEEIIGRWMQRRGNRHQMIIATKVYQPMGEHPNDRGLSCKHIIEALEASLRRLHTDYLPVPDTRLRCRDAYRGDAPSPRGRAARRQDPLRGRLQLSRLALRRGVVEGRGPPHAAF